MINDTEYLEMIAQEIAEQYALNGALAAEKANRHLINEAKRIEKSFISRLLPVKNKHYQSNSEQRTINKLVSICDMLFKVSGSVDPNILTIIKLLDAIRQTIPEDLRPYVKIPKGFIALHHSTLTEAMEQHVVTCHTCAVDSKLTDISSIPFTHFTETKDRLSWANFTWLQNYRAKLFMFDWNDTDCNSKTEALMSLLISLDFNHEQFYIYCKKYVAARAKAISGKRKRLLEYAECEKLVLQETQIGIPSFDPYAKPVSSRLIKWIREEINFVETHERDRPYAKFEFKWNVEMIAFFFKLLHERGAFGKISLEPFAETIATNCSSVGKEDFQPATIQSRFYVKDQVIIKSIEAVLLEMLEVVGKYLR